MVQWGGSIQCSVLMQAGAVPKCLKWGKARGLEMSIKQIILTALPHTPSRKGGHASR